MANGFDFKTAVHNNVVPMQNMNVNYGVDYNVNEIPQPQVDNDYGTTATVGTQLSQGERDISHEEGATAL